MKKKWLIPIVGISLTAIFTYFALTYPDERIANLMSDFAGWSIGATGILTGLTYLSKKMF